MQFIHRLNYMQKTKQYLLLAFAAFAAPLAHAAPATVIDAGTALSQPAVAGAITSAETAPVNAPAIAPVSTEHQVRVTQQAAAEAEVAADGELSNWSMLLVGAGVLLLPRKRRVDNSVR